MSTASTHPLQPIYTAPQDGRPILVLDPDDRCDEQEGWRVAWYRGGGWRWFDQGGIKIDCYPSWWMPLPIVAIGEEAA